MPGAVSSVAGQRLGKKSLRLWGSRLRVCHELGKTLNELMGWPGSITRRQCLAWLFWLTPENERTDDPAPEGYDEWVADRTLEAAKIAAMRDANVINVKRSELRPGLAAELLLKKSKDNKRGS